MVNLGKSNEKWNITNMRCHAVWVSHLNYSPCSIEILLIFNAKSELIPESSFVDHIQPKYFLTRWKSPFQKDFERNWMSTTFPTLYCSLFWYKSVMAKRHWNYSIKLIWNYNQVLLAAASAWNYAIGLVIQIGIFIFCVCYHLNCLLFTFWLCHI